jgi:hypothetical protein
MISASITKTGRIDFENFKVLMEAYPDWKAAIERKCEQRLIQIFKTANSEIIDPSLLDVSSTQLKIENPSNIEEPLQPIYRRSMTRRYSSANIIISLYEPALKPNQNIWSEILHLILILFTSFSISLSVGFDIRPDITILVFESL